ncbi:MAG: hypothetical protein WC291_08895, partial [Thermodesulfovibrionales bacterium]
TVSGSTGDGISIFSDITAPLVQNVNLNSSISGNTVQNNGGNGVSLGNDLYAHVGQVYNPEEAVVAQNGQSLTATLENSSIVNDLWDNKVNSNGQMGVQLLNELSAEYQGLGGNLPAVTVSVINSGITNCLTGNSIGRNAFTGALIENMVNVSAYINNGTIDVFTGNIAGSSIANNLLNNVVNKNGDEGVNNLNRVSGYAGGGYGGGISQAAINIASSQITNLFSDNSSISENGSTGLVSVNHFEAGTGLIFIPYAPDITSAITGSGISNTIENNSLDLNGGDGANVVNIFEAGSVTGFTINNLLAHNTVTGTANQAQPDRAVAQAEFADGIFLVNAGHASTLIDTLAVTNSLSGNTVQDHTDTGIILVNEFSVGQGRFRAAEDGQQPALPSATITGATIVNNLTDNRVTGNGFDGAELFNQFIATGFADMSDLVLAIENSHISNTLENNQFNGNGDDGLDLFNDIHINAGVGYFSNVLADIKGSSINNTMAANAMNRNGGQGVFADSFIDIVGFVTDPSAAFTGSICTASINGSYRDNEAANNGDNGVLSFDTISITADGGEGPVGIAQADLLTNFNAAIVDAVMSDSLVNNSITGNGFTGAELSYFTEPAPSLGSTVDIFMERNRVQQNGGDGVFIESFGQGSFTANLGDAAAGTGGFNSFTGNGGFDLNNFSDLPITAENNWWGQDTGPAAGQINNPGSVDADPWLTAAP